MNPLRLALANGDDREVIYRMRHAVYAAELGQHALNSEERLSDPSTITTNMWWRWKTETLAWAWAAEASG